MKNSTIVITKKERDVFEVDEYLEIKELIHWLQGQLEKGATHIELTQDYVGNTLTTSMKFKEN